MTQLPLRYQIALWVVGFYACVAAGALIALSAPAPVVWEYGALAGAAVGPLLMAVYCRSFSSGCARAAEGRRVST